MVGELRASHVIHLHRLLAAVREEFEEDGFDPDRLEAYRDHGVAPTDFKATKADHERALMDLSGELSAWAVERLDREAAERATAEGTEPGEEETDTEPVEAGATPGTGASR